MNMFDPLSLEKTLSIMPTWRCTAECLHCGTLSSPRENTWLPIDAMLSAIDQAAENGYKVVVFTGGEPTLAGDNLLMAIEHASARGLYTRIVSNAYWASSDTRADTVVSAFVHAGLTEINFSTGDQHVRFVPLDNVIRATRASVKAGRRVFIMVEHVKERRVTKDVLERHPEFLRMREDFPRASVGVRESPWMPMSSSFLNDYQEGLLANASNVTTKTGCDDVLRTTTVEADGTIAACCGIGMRLIPELRLGNIRDTTLETADTHAANDFLKRWIHIEGPERILAWAATFDPGITWENMYAHRCQACIRIYQDPAVSKVIAEHYEERIADVLVGEWLLYHYKAAEPLEEHQSPG